jgi:hypothetical protein
MNNLKTTIKSTATITEISITEQTTSYMDVAIRVYLGSEVVSDKLITTEHDRVFGVPQLNELVARYV